MSRVIQASLFGLICAAAGCGSPPPKPPRRPAEGEGRITHVTDKRFQYARTIAVSGGVAPTPHLDALARRVGETTPELGLDELLAAGGSTTLRPGDRVHVTVIKQPSSSGERILGADGSFELSPLGLVEAAGLSTADLAAKLARDLEAAGSLVDARVTVRLIERSGRTVQVVGQAVVNDAGGAELGPAGMATEFPLPPERGLTVYDLIIRAQGLADDADESRLTLVRRARESARFDCFHFTFDELVTAHLEGRGALLEPDDQLVIPRLPDVFVYGAVANPGRYPLRSGATVATLLLASGGAGEVSDIGAVLLLDGTKVGTAGVSDALEPGQVVFVPASKRVYVVGPGVARNGPLILPHSGLTCLQAIAEAGWFTATADLDAVEILRPGPGGRQERIRVPVEAILAGEVEGAEFMLVPGDTIVAPEAIW